MIKNFVQYCIQEFNFNPKTIKEERNNNPNNLQNQKVLDICKLPEDDISNVFCNECLSFLAKTDADFKKNNKKLKEAILIIIYNHFKGSVGAILLLEIYEIHYPMQLKFENFEKSLDKKEDFDCFQLFNLLLLKYKGVNEYSYNNNNFIILEALLLYDYAFIRNYQENKKFKKAVRSIIKALIEYYIKLTGENIISRNLKNLIYEGGNIKNNMFLVPQCIYTNGYKKFDDLIENINQIIICELSVESFVNNLNDFNDFKRLKLDLEEDTEETELSSEGNNNNGNSINENYVNESTINIQNENNKKFSDLNDKINKLMESDKAKDEKINQLMKSDKAKDEKINQLMKSVTELMKLNAKKSITIAQREKDLEMQKNIIDSQELDIKELHYSISNREFTIEQKDQNIKELKKDINEKNKDLRENKNSLDQYKIKIDNQDSCILKQQQQITKLNQTIYDMGKENTERDKKINDLNKDLKMLSNKMDLIGCRDFLRKIFNDFCSLFCVFHNGNYAATANIIAENIKNTKDNELKKFALKVNLIKFIKNLANLIEDSDNLSHYFFKELSIRFENENVQEITTEEDIKKNITKCQQAFNQYFNYNFDLYFNFLKNECDYSNYIFNNLEISNNSLLDAIKRFNNNDNNKNI